MSAIPIAMLQMTSGIDPEVNFCIISEAAAQASAEGAKLLVTPEMAILLDRDRKRAAATMCDPAYAIIIERLIDVSRDCEIDILIGSMPIPLAGGMFANRSVYLRANSGTPTTYDKIHMFDVQLESGESWKESSVYKPGNSVVTVDDTPLGRIGFSICYDVRFPAIYEELGRRECDVITVPAAFTVPTGQAHWHLMLRARAVEASAFVLAPAQVGHHEDGRQTYGHSLVVDPWGEVLLDLGGREAGLAFCDIDLSRIDDVRKQIPSLANRREIAT